MHDGRMAVRVHQCLFGYDDGHRLLAASIHLPSDIESLLLPLSDLAPGLDVMEFQPYWTGAPLTRFKSYALMRTWPAPEVSRPGCVWTHALILNSSAIARFINLGVLRQLATRPVIASRPKNYLQPLLLDITQLERTVDGPPYLVSGREALELLRAVYAREATGTVAAHPGALDDAVFALWSQQWPRLRQSFGFRTTGSSLDPPKLGVRLHLRIRSHSSADSAESSTDLRGGAIEPWEAAAVDDLRSSEPTDFRRFLWRYGSDVRRGRERFQLLAELYVNTRLESLTDGDLETALSTVSAAMPTLDDGRTLKRDLVSCGASVHSLLPPSAPLDMLAFFVRNPRAPLPHPPAQVFDAIESFWEVRLDEVLAIAELAAATQSEVGDLVLGRVASVAKPDEFLKCTRDHPNLRRRLIQVNPALLNSEELPRVPRRELSELLVLVPDDASVLRSLLGRLIHVDDEELAADVHNRFPDATFHAISEAVGRAAESRGPEVPRSWSRLIATDPAVFLHSGILETASTTRVLAAFAAILGYDRPEVLSAGPLPWARALRAAWDNVEGRDRQIFLAFLLAAALSQPVPGSESLFEKAFEPVDKDLAHWQFSSEAKAILSRHLPDLDWWRQWDTCLGLRVAVVTAYVDGDLEVDSFRRLTLDTHLFEQLVALASETDRGQRYLQRMIA